MGAGEARDDRRARRTAHRDVEDLVAGGGKQPVADAGIGNDRLHIGAETG